MQIFRIIHYFFVFANFNFYTMSTTEQTPSITKALLTLEECANYMGMKKNTLYQMTSKRRIPHYKPGGRLVYFDLDEVNAWLKSNRIAPQSEIENLAASYCRTKNR